MGCCPIFKNHNSNKNNKNCRNKKEKDKSNINKNEIKNNLYIKEFENEYNIKETERNYLNDKKKLENEKIKNNKKDTKENENIKKNTTKKKYQFNNNDIMISEKNIINEININETMTSSYSDKTKTDEKFEVKEIITLKKKSNKNEENKKENYQIKNSINNKNIIDIKNEVNQKEVLNKNIKELEDKISLIKKEKEEINSQCEDLKAKNKEIEENNRKENEELKNKIISLEKKYKDINQNNLFLQKSNETLKNQNIELKDKDAQTQKDIEALQNKNKQMEEKYKLLEKEIKKIYEENLLLKKVPILVGLNNIGATCYMNATLQCLSNTDELTKYFLNKFKYDSNDNNKIISNAYHNVIKNLWNRSNDNKSFSAKEFKEALSRENSLFSGIGTKASKDLINFLLERIHIELNDIKIENKIKKNNYMSSKFDQNNQFNEQAMLNIFTKDFKKEYNSIISHLFFGILETKSQCQRCKYFKYNFQVYNFIEFPLERINQYFFNIGKRLNYNMYDDKNPDIDLYECFEFHNKIEPMIGDNQLYCNNCQDNCDFLYQSSLYSTPKYLIINFFRGRGEVYECNVNFPEQLYLNNFVSNKNYIVYELYGVICQIDSGYMNGSFIAFCKNRIDKKWYKYNDDVVTLCENSNEFRIGMPYILFYKILFNN